MNIIDGKLSENCLLQINEYKMFNVIKLYAWIVEMFPDKIVDMILLINTNWSSKKNIYYSQRVE